MTIDTMSDFTHRGSSPTLLQSAAMPDQPNMMVPGKATLTGGAPPRTTHDLASHTQPKSVFRAPEDEQRIDWGKLVKVSAPPKSLQTEPLIPPIMCPMPPNCVVEGQPFPDDRGDDPPVLLTVPKQQWRQRCWDTYSGAASSVQTMFSGIEHDLRRFQHPEQDNDLRAIGFELPSGYHGDLTGLAGVQRVPNRAGMQVNSLFEGNNIKLGPADHADLNRIGGPDGSDYGFLGTIVADAALRAALHNVRAKAQNLAAQNDSLKAAQARLTAQLAARDITKTESEIQHLRDQTEILAPVIDFIDVGPAKIFDLAKQYSHPGSMCAAMLRMFPNHEIEGAELRLANLRTTMKHAEMNSYEFDLDAAKSRSIAALQELAGAREELSVAAGRRRQAFDETGQKIANVSGNQKLGAVWSAIPIVEEVVASLRHLTEVTRGARPACNDDGALGFGIALAHHYPCAYQLPVAIGYLEFINTYFGILCSDWAERLRSLRGAQKQLMGQRPGYDVDDSAKGGDA